jgi:hypothetical protein
MIYPKLLGAPHHPTHIICAAYFKFHKKKVLDLEKEDNK